MNEVNFKPGQKVNATNAKGEVQPGKYVTTHPGKKGAFVEVQHDTGSKRYRPSKVVAA